MNIYESNNGIAGWPACENYYKRISQDTMSSVLVKHEKRASFDLVIMLSSLKMLNHLIVLSRCDRNCYSAT